METGSSDKLRKQTYFNMLRETKKHIFLFSAERTILRVHTPKCFYKLLSNSTNSKLYQRAWITVHLSLQVPIIFNPTTHFYCCIPKTKLFKT